MGDIILQLQNPVVMGPRVRGDDFVVGDPT